MRYQSFQVHKAIKLAEKLDKNKNYKLSDYILNKILKTSQEQPFQLKEGLDTNDPKTVMDYFMGFAFDMYSRKKDISKKRLELELDKLVDDKIALMSDEDKAKYADLKSQVMDELKNQSYWNSLPEETKTNMSSGVAFDPNSPGFDNAFQYILDVEGGYTDYNPNTGDPRTNLGIIQSEYDKYRSSKGMEQQSVSNITKDEAKEIYFANYWIPTKADRLYSTLPKTAITIFDFAVNSGLGGASSVVSKTLGIPSTRFDDSMFNSIIEAGEQMGDDKLSSNLVGRRYTHYDEIIAKNPQKAVYRKGWQNRLKKLENFSAQV